MPYDCCCRPGDVPTHSLLPATFDERNAWCSSRTFLVRYCDEKVCMQDICLLRMETLEIDGPMEFVLEYILEFGDLNDVGGSDHFEREKMKTTDPLADVVFKRVATHAFRLRMTDGGLQVLTPVTFDEFHCCVVNVCVYASLVDFRLRTRVLPSPEFGPNDIPTDEEDRKAREIACVVSCQTDPKSFYDFLYSFREYVLEPDVFGENLTERERLAAHALEMYAGLLECSHQNLNRFVQDACVSEAKEESGDNDMPDLTTPFVLPTLDISANDGSDLALRGAFVAHLGKAAGQTLHLWQCFMIFIEKNPLPAFQHLLRKHELMCVVRWGELIYRETIVVKAPGLHVVHDPTVAQTHMRVAAKHRSTRVDKEAYEIADLTVFPPGSEHTHPIVFEQRYRSEERRIRTSMESTEHSLPSDPPVYAGYHVFVLVHGFQGSSYDLRAFRNNLVHLYPKSLVLCATANEDQTNGDITRMGMRLASEVSDSIRDWVGPAGCAGRLSRLSFIGHSIGGLIIRAALPYLEAMFAPYFHTLITLGTMHLGYMYNTNKLVDAGIWALHQWGKSECLRQLQMLDMSPKHMTRNSRHSVNQPVENGMISNSCDHTEDPGEGISAFKVAFETRLSKTYKDVSDDALVLRDAARPSDLHDAQSICIAEHPGNDMSDFSDRKESIATANILSTVENFNVSSDDELENTFIYKLSANTAGFNLFRHVVLVSSYLDQYAPYESARVEMSERVRDDKWGDVYGKMVENVLKGVNPLTLLRLDVNFLSPDQSFDSWIGRWAHIQFLENQALIKLLMHSYPYLFR